MATLGIDYYGGETPGPTPPGFLKAKKSGARVILVRGAYGRKLDKNPIHLDPAWKDDKAAIVAAGLKRTAYLFVCMPRKGYTTPDPEVQANAFADYVSELRGPSSEYSGDWPPCFDVEEESSLPADAYRDWITRVATVLHERFGAWPMMYSSQRVWTQHLRNLPPGVLGNCPQWIAKPWMWAPRSPAHMDGAPGVQPDTIDSFGDKTNWIIFQYQGDALGVPGFPSTCDLNRVQIVAEGAKGDIVRYIQSRVGAGIDGIFGKLTKAAVQKFQARFGLVQDGIVGADTWGPIMWQKPSTPYPYR